MRIRLLPLLLVLPPMLATAATAVYVVDGDADGVADTRDRCLYTPQGARVDAFGCSDDDDLDQDQVADLLDRCPKSPIGARVDRYGCAIDSDFDGIADGLDRCELTPLGAWVDARGCPVSATAVATVVPTTATSPVARATIPQTRPAPAATRVPAAPMADVAQAAPRSVLAAMRPIAATVPTPAAPAPTRVAARPLAPRADLQPMLASSTPATPVVAPRAIPVPPPPIRARPTTLNAGSRVAEVPFEGNDSRLQAAGDDALREALSGLQSRLGESADHYVELVGLTSGGRGDSGLMAQRVGQVRSFIEAQGIPAARIVYALRPARRGEQAGRVELHQR